jgi:Eukaryotic-type carbonic anhydrase
LLLFFANKFLASFYYLFYLLQLSLFQNEGISELISGLGGIAFYQNEAPLASTAMMWLQPYMTNISYFHYNGSLTTTPCTEVVTWIVLKNHSTVAKKQVWTFEYACSDKKIRINTLNQAKKATQSLLLIE